MGAEQEHPYNKKVPVTKSMKWQSRTSKHLLMVNGLLCSTFLLSRRNQSALHNKPHTYKHAARWSAVRDAILLTVGLFDASSMFLFCYNVLYFRVISLNVVIVVLQVVSLVLNSMTEDIPLFLSPPQHVRWWCLTSCPLWPQLCLCTADCYRN